MGIETRLVADAAALAEQAADLVAGAASRSLAARGSFALALSGGRTPVRMLAALAARPVDWPRVDVFQVDERVAPDGHPERNLTAIRRHLADPAGLPAHRLHAMPVTAPDLEAAAAGYADELHRVCGGVLDLVHLGLGDDGHTASWPPGDPVAEAVDRDVAMAGPFGGFTRMTLTPPAVNRARHVLWVVEGAGKRGVLRRLLEGDPSIPASRVRSDGVTLLTDALGE